MAVTSHQLGKLNPIIYFENSKGDISLPPSTDDALRIRDRMRHRGYELREADSLAAIDRLQRRMQEQEYRARERNLEREENLLATVRASVRDRLLSRMISSSTPPYEREFIQLYLQCREEKREAYRNRYMADQAYFEAREMYEGHSRIRDSVDNVPDMADTACRRCNNFRRVPNSPLCANCNRELAERERARAEAG